MTIKSKIDSLSDYKKHNLLVFGGQWPQYTCEFMRGSRVDTLRAENVIDDTKRLEK